MTDATTPEPRTAAGRALLRICERELSIGAASTAEGYILAIEAEVRNAALAEGLDVRAAFRILTRLQDDEVDAFARRLIAADARATTPFLDALAGDKP